MIAILGNKQNQIMFYIQTMTIIGYFLDEDYLKITITLSNLRFAIFNFKTGSMFNIFPKDYIESSQGNFKWTIIDSNIFRVTEMLFVVQLVVLMSMLFMKLFNNIKVSLNFKRMTFRFL